MILRACFPTVTLTTLVLLAPCLAGEFGQTRQYFAQYGIGGPAETSFDVHNPGEAVIVVEVELFYHLSWKVTIHQPITGFVRSPDYFQRVRILCCPAERRCRKEPSC